MSGYNQIILQTPRQLVIPSDIENLVPVMISTTQNKNEEHFLSKYWHGEKNRNEVILVELYDCIQIYKDGLLLIPTRDWDLKYCNTDFDWQYGTTSVRFFIIFNEDKYSPLVHIISTENNTEVSLITRKTAKKLQDNKN